MPTESSTTATGAGKSTRRMSRLSFLFISEFTLIIALFVSPTARTLAPTMKARVNGKPIRSLLMSSDEIPSHESDEAEIIK